MSQLATYPSASAARAAGASSPTVPSLEIATAQGTILHVPLTERHVVIGRAPDAALRLEGGTVSRYHAEISLDPFGRWWVRDQGSRNGVRFNGQKVAERMLHPGATFQVGQYRLTFRGPGSSVTGADGVVGLGTDDSISITGSVRLADDTSGQFSTLEEVDRPRISGDHLSALMRFGRELLDIDRPGDRMTALCRLLMREEFKGTGAMIFRLWRGEAPGQAGNAPPILCGPFGTAGGGLLQSEAPYISGTLVRRLRETGQPIMASNVGRKTDTDVEMSISPDVASLAALACPIAGTEDAAGAMDVLYVTLPPQYGTSEWLAVATLAAEQYRNAESAWASKRREKEQDRIEGELRQARQIQISTVPKPLSVPGLDVFVSYQACHWVGGDYADVASARDGRILLAVADVCGKGMPAALIAMSLRTMMRTGLQAMQGPAGLADLLTTMRPQLNDCLQENSFVTMAAVLADPGSGALRCVNAGHPPPFIVNPEGELRELPCAENFPLGVMVEPIECRDEALAPGELLVMFSDGISELCNPAGEMLGVERFAREVAALYPTAADQPTAEIARQITGILDRYRSGRSADDDQTFLLARRV